jgi:hypothetical protein
MKINGKGTDRDYRDGIADNIPALWNAKLIKVLAM